MDGASFCFQSTCDLDGARVCMEMAQDLFSRDVDFFHSDVICQYIRDTGHVPLRVWDSPSR